MTIADRLADAGIEVKPLDPKDAATSKRAENHEAAKSAAQADYTARILSALQEVKS